MARRALEHLYAIGRVEGDLPTVLSEIAGIASDMHLPDSDEIRRLVAEVQAQGDAARGEAVFRRSNLSCLKCHSVSGAGGNIGPELSAVGGISPIEYLVTSVLAPESPSKRLSNKPRCRPAKEMSTRESFWKRTRIDRAEGCAGNIIKIPRDGEEVIKKGGSLMPKGLVNLMSHADFLDLVRFLSELRQARPLGAALDGHDSALAILATRCRFRSKRPMPTPPRSAPTFARPTRCLAAGLRQGCRHVAAR